MTRKILIVGAGGIGSWLASTLYHLKQHKQLPDTHFTFSAVHETLKALLYFIDYFTRSILSIRPHLVELVVIQVNNSFSVFVFHFASWWDVALIAPGVRNNMSTVSC